MVVAKRMNRRPLSTRGFLGLSGAGKALGFISGSPSDFFGAQAHGFEP